MVRLMNSAMIPEEGVYQAMRITEEQAKEIFQHYVKLGHPVQSYIGYEQTANYMSTVLDYQVPVNRSETTLEDGDVIIVCKLKYRVPNPQDKGKPVSNDDFEWFYITYRRL